MEKFSIKKALENALPFHVKYYLSFWKTIHRRPRLFHPKDYRDYVFRANFFNVHKSHAYLADKLLVRNYVKEKGLENTLTKLYGSWDDANKVDFNKFPNQFAIKCNHSADMNIIVYDKSKLDIEEARAKLDKWMHMKHYAFFERHYMYIKPMILCEELIPSNEDGTFPIDYKIHCANGKPVFIQCCTERSETSGGKRVIYSPQWERLPYTIESDAMFSEVNTPRPVKLDEMLKVASILSTGLEYARIDLYEVDRVVDGKEEHRIIFGEITLTPQGGLLTYYTQEALDVMGKEIKDNRNKHKLID